MSGNAEKSAGRAGEPPTPAIDCFRGQHLELAERQIATELGRANVIVDEAESPLAWLARRRGRNGRALIEPHQFQAGERLRADFTRAHMMPRTTSNWSSLISSGRRGAGGERAAAFTETMVAARQRVHQALDVVGRNSAGCCSISAVSLKVSKISNANAPGRHVRPRSCCSSRSIGSHVIKASRRRSGGPPMRPSARGSPTARRLESMAGNDHAAGASAALASARMRSTIDRRPFERCGVRFSRKPMRSNSFSASVARISRALLPE